MAIARDPANAGGPPQKGAVVKAIADLDPQTTRDLLSGGADVNENVGTADKPLTPMLAAIAMGQSELIRDVLAFNPNLAATYGGFTAYDFVIHTFPHDADLQETFRKGTPDSQYETPERTPHSAAWVANALASQALADDYGTVLGLAYIASVYRSKSEPKPDRDVTLRQAFDLKYKYNRAARLASRTPPATRSSTSLADILFDPSTKKNADAAVAVRVARMAVDADAAETELSQGNMDKAGVYSALLHVTYSSSATRYAKLRSFQLAVLEATHAMGTKDKEGIGWVVDTFAGPVFNANLSHDSATIRANNPANFIDGIDRYFQPDAAAVLDLGSINADFQAFTSQLTADARRRIDDLKTGAEAAVPDPAVRDQQRLAAAESTVYLLSTFAGFADKGAAKTIKVVGGAAVDIAKSLMDYGKYAAMAGMALMSAITLVGGIATALMSIGSLLFGGGPDLQKEILDNIKTLQTKLVELRAEMHERFDRIDRQLATIYDQITRDEVARRLGELAIHEQLRDLATELAIIGTELDRLDSSVRTYVEAAADRTMWRALLNCLEHESHHDEGITYDQFTECLQAFLNGAVVDARDALSVGIKPVGESDEDFHRALAGMETLDQKLALIQYGAQLFGYTGSLFTGTMANPARLAMSVEGYASIVHLYADYFLKHTTSDGVVEMLAIATGLRDAFQSLGDRGTWTDPNPLFAKLVKNYRDKSLALRGTLKTIIAHFQTDPLKAVEGYDLWGGPNQALQPDRAVFAATTIAISPDYDPRSLPTAPTWPPPPEAELWDMDYRFAAPPQLANADAAQSVIPRCFLMAHQLGLGVIEVGYRDFCWAEFRNAEVKPSENRYYGKAGLTIEAAFRRNDGARFRIFSRHANSGHEYNFGIQTFNTDMFGRRISPSWGHGALREDGGASMDIHDRQCFERQIKNPQYWQELLGRLFVGRDNDGVSDDERSRSVQAVSDAIDAYFSARRDQLEAEVQDGFLRGSKPDLKDSVVYLTGAKKLLSAIATLAFPITLSTDESLRGLLFGAVTDTPIQGNSPLFDDKTITEYLAHKGSMTELARDPRWLDLPAMQLDGKLKGLLGRQEVEPVLDNTIDKLKLLKRMHDAASPPQALKDVFRELRQSVSELRHS